MAPVVRRVLTVLVTVDVLAFVVAYSERHATRGAAETVGAVAWFCFLLGVLLTLVTGVIGLTQLAVRRHRQQSA